MRSGRMSAFKSLGKEKEPSKETEKKTKTQKESRRPEIIDL